MYACMCVGMYACMHACMHACMYVCIYVCTYVCLKGRNESFLPGDDLVSTLLRRGGRRRCTAICAHLDLRYGLPSIMANGYGSLCAWLWCKDGRIDRYSFVYAHRRRPAPVHGGKDQHLHWDITTAAKVASHAQVYI